MAPEGGWEDTQCRQPASDLDDDRQDHRAAVELLVDEAADRVVQVLLDQVDLADVEAVDEDDVDRRESLGWFQPEPSAATSSRAWRKISPPRSSL
jgi:hypothetical protein